MPTKLYFPYKIGDRVFNKCHVELEIIMADYFEGYYCSDKNYYLPDELHYFQNPDGRFMKIEDFVECCESKLFIDYDGFGEYAYPDGILTGIYAIPSEIYDGIVNKEFSHVVWYNK